MQIGMIGLGRMGSNIVRRLLQNDHTCTVFDRNPDAAKALQSEGAVSAEALADLVGKLTAPRIVWIMLPAGAATGSTIEALAGLLEAGDIVIDGGNSYYKDDIDRARMLQTRGLHFVDVGTSGGIWGLERGYCMMIGGETAIVDHLDPIFAALAPGLGDIPKTPGRDGKESRAERGYIHAGPNGAGHFVKMIHNGIEYGLMQAYAEGFAILEAANGETLPDGQRFDINLADVAEVWRRGSVISSWLLDLTADALARDPALDAFEGIVQDSGEGRWTVEAAIETAVPVHVLSAALFARFRSRLSANYADKMLSAMRNGFGGHVEPATKDR